MDFTNVIPNEVRNLARTTARPWQPQAKLIRIKMRLPQSDPLWPPELYTDTAPAQARIQQVTEEITQHIEPYHRQGDE